MSACQAWTSSMPAASAVLGRSGGVHGSPAGVALRMGTSQQLRLQAHVIQVCGKFMPAPHTTCKRAHYGRGRVRPRRRAPAGAGWATARTAASWCWRPPPTRTHCPPRWGLGRPVLMRQLRGAPVHVLVSWCSLPYVAGNRSVGSEWRWPDRRLAGRAQGLVPLLGVDVWEHAYYLQVRRIMGRAVRPLLRVHAVPVGSSSACGPGGVVRAGSPARSTRHGPWLAV